MLNQGINKYSELIKFFSDFSETLKYSDEDFFSEILNIGVKIFSCDYGSVYFFNGETGKFINSIGHDMSLLKELVVEKSYFYLSDDVMIIDEINDFQQVPISEEIAEVFLNASKPIKSTILCPILLNSEFVAGVCFDLDPDNPYTFTEEDIEIAKALREIVETYLAIKFYNNKIIESNTILTNSLKIESKTNEKLIKLVTVLANLTSYLEQPYSVVMPELLNIAHDIIECDYGSAFILDGGNWKYIGSIGHDISVFKDIEIKKDYLFNAGRNVFLISEILNIARTLMPDEIFDKFLAASKPIKSTILCPLYQNDQCLGGLTFDLSKDNEKSFTDQDIEIAKVFKVTSETVLNIKFYTSMITETKNKLKNYNALLEEKVNQRALELEEEEQLFRLENKLKLEAEQKERQIAEELKDSLKVMSSSLNTQEVINLMTERLKRILTYNRIAVFLKTNDKYELISSNGYESSPRLTIEESIKDNHICFGFCNKKSQCKYFISDKIGIFISENNDENNFCLPIYIKNEIIGVIKLDCPKEMSMSESDISLLNTFLDLSSLAIENSLLFDEINKLATLDGLTGIYNRRYFYELASKELIRSKRYEGFFSTIMLDIDHFKSFNDTYGHLIGDEVLKFVAKKLRYSLRDIDVIARYGGEEFVILLPLTNLDGAKIIAERIRKNIMKSKIFTEEGELSITISLGVSDYNTHIEKIEEILAFADEALYEAKNSGRNKVCYKSTSPQ